MAHAPRPLRFLVAAAVAATPLRVAHAQPFDDVSGAWGFPTQVVPASGFNLVAAASMADLDGDGDLDLVRSGGPTPPRLYRRASMNGVFGPDDLAFAGATSGLSETNGHLLFDMDGDGDRDVLFLRDNLNVLFENRGGAFFDVTDSHFPSLEGWSSSAAAGDLDGDGDLDLVVARYIDRVDFPIHICLDNLILENDGAGHFTDRSRDVGFDQVRGCSFMTALVDIDDDLDLDIMVVNDFARFRGGQELWINDGDFQFREVAKDVGLVAPLYGMGVALGDPDQDGRWDAVLSNIGEPMAFERDAAASVQFHDALAERGLAVRFAADQHQVSWTAQWEDVDADGYLDLVMASGQLPAATFIGNTPNQKSMILRGNAAGKLVEVDAASGFIDPDHSARDVHFEDLDNDGRLEMIMAHISTRVGIYRNNHALPVGTTTTFELAPTTTGAGAAGADVRAVACGITRHRGVVGGAAYGSSDRGIVRFAFPSSCPGAGRDIDAIVRWPSGYQQSVATTTGQTLKVTEPAWIDIDPDGGDVTVDLSGHAANVTNVFFIGHGVIFGAMTPLGGKRWKALYDFEAGADAARFDIVVDGVIWGAHPRLRRKPYVPLQIDPPHVPVGHAFLVSTLPNASVTWLGDTVTSDSQGRVTLTAPDEPGAPLVAVTSDGLSASAKVDVVPRADRLRSELTARELHILQANVGSSTLRLRARLLDANGSMADVPISALQVAIDNQVEDPDQVTLDGDWWTVRVSHARLRDRAVVQLVIDGEAWFEPYHVAQLANAGDVANLVDASQSGCWLSEPRLWQGGDRGTVLGLLMDERGIRLPDFGVLPSFSSIGVSLVPGGQEQLGTLGYSALVQATTTEGTVRFGFPGQPEAVVCAVSVGPRPAFEPAASANIQLIGGQGVVGGVAAPWRIWPLGVSGRGIGGGVDVELDVIGGSASTGPGYTGMGHYDYTITPDLGAETMTVIALEGTREIGRVQVAVQEPVIEPDAAPEKSPETSDGDATTGEDDTIVGGGDDAEVIGGDDAEVIGPGGDADDAIEGGDTLNGGGDDADVVVSEDTAVASDALDDVGQTGGDASDATDPGDDVGAPGDDVDAQVEAGDDAGATGLTDATGGDASERSRASDDGCAGGGAGVDVGLAAALLALARRAHWAFRRAMRRAR